MRLLPAGLIIIPGAAAGQMFGGISIRRWKLKVRGILRLTLLLIALAAMSKACFFINCDMYLWNTTLNDRLENKHMWTDDCFSRRNMD